MNPKPRDTTIKEGSASSEGSITIDDAPLQVHQETQFKSEGWNWMENNDSKVTSVIEGAPVRGTVGRDRAIDAILLKAVVVEGYS